LIVGAALIAVGAVAWWLRVHLAQVRELRASHERLRGMVAAAGEGMGELSGEGGMVRASPALARIFGCASPDELLALTPADLARRHVFPAAWEQRLRRAVAGEAVEEVEAELRHDPMGDADPAGGAATDRPGARPPLGC
jgi:PAS domain-containing protein